MPTFEVGGETVKGEDFFAALNADLAPAAGPAAARQMANGGRFHDYASADLVDGLDSLGAATESVFAAQGLAPLEGSKSYDAIITDTDAPAAGVAVASAGTGGYINPLANALTGFDSVNFREGHRWAPDDNHPETLIFACASQEPMHLTFQDTPLTITFGNEATIVINPDGTFEGREFYDFSQNDPFHGSVRHGILRELNGENTDLRFGDYSLPDLFVTYDQDGRGVEILYSPVMRKPVYHDATRGEGDIVTDEISIRLSDGHGNVFEKTVPVSIHDSAILREWYPPEYSVVDGNVHAAGVLNYDSVSDGIKDIRLEIKGYDVTVEEAGKHWSVTENGVRLLDVYYDYQDESQSTLFDNYSGQWRYEQHVDTCNAPHESSSN